MKKKISKPQPRPIVPILVAFISAIALIIAAMLQNPKNTEAVQMVIDATQTGEAKLTQTALIQGAPRPSLLFSPPSQPPNSYWPLIYNENFSSNNTSWYTNNWNDSNTTGNIYIERRFTIEVEDHGNGYEGTYVKNSFEIGEKFYIEVDVQKLRGGETSGYGLLFRYRSNDGIIRSFYHFEIRNDGTFSVGAVENNIPVTLFESSSSLIIPREINELGVLGDDINYTFFINDTFISEIKDSRLQYGFIGFWHENEPNEDVIIEFDNLKVYKP